MKIGIVLASVRDERNGKQVADWVLDYVNKRNDEGVTYELVDLKDYDLPLLGTSVSEEQGKAIGSWSSKMESSDGYIFVTPEYNRVIPGAFKNALDYLQKELHDKAVGYVAYGGLGGLSAIQSLRLINGEQEMADVRTMVTFSIMADFENMSVFKPNDYHSGNMDLMLSQLLKWSKALKTIR